MARKFWKLITQHAWAESAMAWCACPSLLAIQNANQLFSENSWGFGTKLIPWVGIGLLGGIAGGGLAWWMATRQRCHQCHTNSGQSLQSDGPDARLYSALSAARAETFEIDIRSERLTGSAGLNTLLEFEESASPQLKDYLHRLHPEDCTRITDLIQQSVEKGVGHFAECRVVLPSGQQRWIGIRAEPMWNGTGKVERLAGTLIDISERKKAEAALVESEQRFRSLFEHNIDGIFSIDPEGRFQDANPAALRLCHYSLAELRERHITDLCAPEMIDVTAECFRKTLAGGSHQIETKIIRKDGYCVEILVCGTPIVVDGRTVGIFAVVEDISERKRSQRALDDNERRLQLALDAGQMGLWTWDLEKDVVILDAANRRLFGIDTPGDTFLTEELYQKIHPDDQPLVRQELDKLLAGNGDYHAEFRVLLPEGRIRWLAGRGRIVQDHTGKAVQVAGVNFDVTQHQVTTEQLNLARIAAETASRAKDDFIAALSHELRTPLSPVLILASEQEQNPALTPELRGDFAMVRKNVEMEAHLIDDLLDLTRIARGKLRLDLRTLDLHALCREAVEMLRPEINAKRLDLSVECTGTRKWISGDAVRLQQVFWNLLKNAVKFTPQGGRIDVHLGDIGEASILIRIEDTGIGIDPENLELVFNAFEQGDAATNRRFGGLGLGLAISRTLVQMHGGRIWATSHGRDKGTCFHLELPATESAVAQSGITVPPDQKLPPRRILLVEDDEATRATLERLLQRRGHHVTALSLVTSAAEAARKEHFDFIISDLGLPDGSGHELMARLRNIPGLQGIALSGYGMEDDVARSRENGFAVHLTKPIDIKTLDRTLAQLSSTVTASS